MAVFGAILAHSSAVHRLPPPRVWESTSPSPGRPPSRSGLKRLAVIASLIFVAARGAEAGALTIAWDPASDPSVTGYNVYWGTQTGVYTNVVNAGLSTQFQVGGLVNGVTYYLPPVPTTAPAS